MERYTTKNFIEKAKQVHGNKYDYSFTEYKNIRAKVTIKCPIHGHFEQKAKSHLEGSGCRKCYYESIPEKTKNRKSYEFIENSRKIHGDKYDYSNVDYIDHKTKVKIVCPEHGEFFQKPSEHLRGNECPKCSNNKKITTKEFIERAKKIHGDEFSYSLVNYDGMHKKITITCPKHGNFEQSPRSHLNGHKCPECYGNKKLTTEEIIKKAKKIHGDKYDYSNVDYANLNTDIKIICPEHGEFEQSPHNHFQGKKCIKCSLQNTNPELEIEEFLNSLNIGFEKNNRTALENKELDFFIPNKNLAIEFNGLYWHNELHKDKNYHLNKTKECENKGIEVMHVFEDEWLHKPEIVKSMIKNKLNITPNKIYARKCNVQELSSKEAKEFCENNHIQGYINSSIKLGLFYKNELVSVMTLGKLRKALNSNSDKNQYELIRFCNKLNTTVLGGASKLFNYFIKNYKPKNITSYSDKRYSSGDLYKNLNFQYIHDSKPNYFYIDNKNKKRKHRFNYRKDKLVEEGYDPNKTEHDIMIEREMYRIYDCGNQKWQFNIH